MFSNSKEQQIRDILTVVVIIILPLYYLTLYPRLSLQFPESTKPLLVTIPFLVFCLVQFLASMLFGTAIPPALSRNTFKIVKGKQAKFLGLFYLPEFPKTPIFLIS